MNIALEKVKTIGSGLLRPEGVMALDDGSLYAADGKGRCARIEKDGRTSFFGNVGGLPNGLCVDRSGSCIIANIGNGEVQSLNPDGSHRVLMTEANGKKMPSPNFPFMDSRERIWVSNSTAHQDLREALQSPSPDGCVVLIEQGTPRIVAEGICFANGVALDPEEKYLYVAETMMRRILRYQIYPSGALSGPEVYGPPSLGSVGYPDGIAFDKQGNLWVVFPAWNAIGYIDPKGNLEMVLEDRNGQVLHRPSNICFGWEGRKTAFVGSLDGTTIPYFAVPYPGMRLVHQRV
jgi:sugar lactone lactonase YvrE